MHNFYVFRAEFQDPFNTLTADGIVTNPIDIVHSCVGKTLAHLEEQLQVEEGRDNVEASITQKIYLNEAWRDVPVLYRSENADISSALALF